MTINILQLFYTNYQTRTCWNKVCFASDYLAICIWLYDFCTCVWNPPVVFWGERTLKWTQVWLDSIKLDTLSLLIENIFSWLRKRTCCERLMPLRMGETCRMINSVTFVFWHYKRLHRLSLLHLCVDIFRRNGHLVGWKLSDHFYLLPLQHLKTYE